MGGLNGPFLKRRNSRLIVAPLKRGSRTEACYHKPMAQVTMEAAKVASKTSRAVPNVIALSTFIALLFSSASPGISTRVDLGFAKFRTSHVSHIAQKCNPRLFAS